MEEQNLTVRRLEQSCGRLKCKISAVFGEE
jgi:3-methyladenine DNA glycosylase AlkC